MQRQPPPVADATQTLTGDGGEKSKKQDAGAIDSRTRIEQAETRTEEAKTRTEAAEARAEQAESRTELAKTRTEQAEARTEQAETRAEQAETRTEQAETRTEQAETALQGVVGKEVHLGQESSGRLPKNFGLDEIANQNQNSPLDPLTSRQREVLQLIAEGQNTKGIAELLKLSPKTVEYHRMKVMNSLNVHDIPGLVRFALRVGMIRPDT